MNKFKVGDIVAFNKDTGGFNFNRILYSYADGCYDVEIICMAGKSVGMLKEYPSDCLSPLSFEQTLLATKLGVI